MTGSIKILHLSDMHFDRHTRYGARDGDTPDAYRRQLKSDATEDYLKWLARDVTKLSPPEDRFDLIAVTGDLVDFDQWRRGKHRAALDKAHDYLLGLCASLGVTAQDGLLIIPGNHDYLWKGIKCRSGAPGRFANRFGSYRDHRWYPEMNLLVGCFDSNVDTVRMRIATGYVGRDQFDGLETAIRDQELAQATRSAFRLALVHHHVLPIATAENLRPTSWWERWIGRRFLGTPELMLMRDSGHFLRFLLGHGFRLVLHGHLHARDCQQYQAIRDGRDRLVEVIACGATIRHCQAEASACAFNVIRLYPDGFVEAQAYRVTQGGELEEPSSLGTAAYEAVRLSDYDARAPLPEDAPPHVLPPDPPVRCRKYTQFWDVSLPAGDIVIREHIEGLCCGDDTRPVGQLLLPVTGEQVNDVAFEAPAGKDRRVTTDAGNIVPLDQGQKLQAQCRVLFDPPLGPGECIDLRLSSRVWGGFFSSQEAERRLADPETAAKPDRLIWSIRWPCEQLLLRLRFSSATWGPRQIKAAAFCVGAEDGKEVQTPARREDLTPHVMMSESADPASPPEALLAVYRPRVGYAYALSWEKPEFDPIPPEQRSTLENFRGLLLALRADGREAARQAARDFLTAARNTVSSLSLPDSSLKPRDNSGMAVQLAAGLFAFDPQSGQLECVAEVNLTNLQFTSVRWGRDVIGTAFRRHAPVFYDYDDSLAKQKNQAAKSAVYADNLRRLPKNVHSLYAYPLYAPDVEWPVGILALATTVHGSLLKAILRPDRSQEGWAAWEKLRQQLEIGLSHCWLKHFKKLLEELLGKPTP